MGQVYRARDTRLGRQVAIKVLPDAVANDPDRLARFEREARVLAALNHPLIAQLYGVEETQHTRAIVMELVEGPTLEEQIAHGPIAVADALPYCPADRRGARDRARARDHPSRSETRQRQAQAQGTPGGLEGRRPTRAESFAADLADCAVKVLDFGLARATDRQPGSDSLSSPTVTSAATELGTILGTAAYMAPEQARGRPVDRRADVWAFGVVLYEMLTGARLFKGENASDTIAAVLRQPIALTALPPDTPAGVRVLLERCLEREPRQRLRDIGEARIGIDRAIASPTAGPMVAGRSPRARTRRARTLVPMGAFGAAAIALAGSRQFWARRHRPRHPRQSRASPPTSASPDRSWSTRVLRPCSPQTDAPSCCACVRTTRRNSTCDAWTRSWRPRSPVRTRRRTRSSPLMAASSGSSLRVGSRPRRSRAGQSRRWSTPRQAVGRPGPTTASFSSSRASSRKHR